MADHHRACLRRAQRADLAERRSHLVGGKVNPWFTVHQMATKSLSGLALRLRVSPQARSPKAPKTKPMTLSAYERMARAEEPDDETKPS